MYRLFNVDTDEDIGVLTEEQIQFIIDNLEEEGFEDQDYYIDKNTLSFFEEVGCDSELLELLGDALGEEKGINIRYELD